MNKLELIQLLAKYDDEMEVVMDDKNSGWHHIYGVGIREEYNQIRLCPFNIGDGD